MATGEETATADAQRELLYELGRANLKPTEYQILLWLASGRTRLDALPRTHNAKWDALRTLQALGWVEPGEGNHAWELSKKGRRCFGMADPPADTVGPDAVGPEPEPQAETQTPNPETRGLHPFLERPITDQQSVLNYWEHCRVHRSWLALVDDVVRGGFRPESLDEERRHAFRLAEEFALRMFGPLGAPGPAPAKREGE